MKLNEKALALALGKISALSAFVCATLIRFWPEQTMKFFGWVAHIDLVSFVPSRVVTWSNFFGGIIVMFVAGFVVGWLLAWLYNKFLEQKTS